MIKNLLFGCIFLLVGCNVQKEDTIFQVSTIDALLTGVFDGSMSCGSLLKQGDQGIGTFNALDGEMLIVDGKIYQVKSDGKVYEPEHSALTPFAAVCHFRKEIAFSIDTLSDLARIEKLIDQQAGNPNLFCAIKISGQFKMMRTRSVPRQGKPYPLLTEVTAHQPEFNLENISGTIVGFRFPSYIKGINMPGYHLHFISSDHTRGGHILGFELASGNCEIDLIHQFSLKLPEKDSAFAVTDLSKDRSVELKKAEG